MAKAKRAVFLGLDAMVPTMVERFLSEGAMPNLARLIGHGVFTRIRPVIPAQTPTNWTTLATGATPGNHGIVQWGSHLPGEPVWEYHRAEAFNAGLCRAEYLWETAARAGVRSVVVNYAGYPPTTEMAVHIDRLFQPARSYYDLAAPTVYHNLPDQQGGTLIELHEATGWTKVPESKLPPLETEVEVLTATEGTGPCYQVLIWSRNDGYDTVTIAQSKDCQTQVAELSVREWSAWLRAPFTTADQGDCEGAFRFKLLEIAPDASVLRLFRLDAFPTDGRMVSNPWLGERLVEVLGPYLHAGGSCGLHCHGLLDFDTVDQIMGAEANRWAKAVHLAVEEFDAALVYLHWHILDEMGHTFQARVDPTGTDYDPDNLEENWGILRDYYRAADRFVGAFVEELNDRQTVFAIASDHGTPANAKAVSLINLFKTRGWLTLSDDGRHVDWKRSKVFFSQNHLWLNLEGRDEGGIVPQEEYEDLRKEVLSALRDLKDPDTGCHVLPIVLAREDAPMIGLWGEYIGDIVFVYAGGYRWSGDETLRLGEERLIFPCGGGNHGPMIPTYETEVSSVMGALILSGAGVKRGVTVPRDAQFSYTTADVAPTLAHLLGLEPPAQNEGRILHEFVQGSSSRRPDHPLVPTDRPLVKAPARRPQRPALQGDVTDEQ